MSLPCFPSDQNPLKIVVPGHVPALKNRKVPIKRGGRTLLVSNKTVTNWMAHVKPLIRAAWAQAQEEHGYVRLEPPFRACIYVEIVFYRADSNTLPASDTDNAATTIQEMLQQEVKKRKGYEPKIVWPGIVLNDKQIVPGTDSLFTNVRELEHAAIYIFLKDESVPARLQYGRLNVQAEAPVAAPLPPLLADLLTP
jgi:hypothetical protein